MQHLPPLVRRKAVEIANALLAEGHDERFAIRVGIARGRGDVESIRSDDVGRQSQPPWKPARRRPART